MEALFGLVVLILDVIAIIDVLKSGSESGKKLLWILLVILLPVVGMILYFVLNKKATQA